MRLRLFHAPDGARVAYREAGSGPALVLLHSALLSHREFEPVVEHLADRYRLVLPDLPVHGDSEDRPRHPYTLDWLAEVMAAFCVDVAGPRPLVGGHELGAELLLRAIAAGRLRPRRLVLMPTALGAPAPLPRPWSTWRTVARAGAVPGADRVVTHLARAAFHPGTGIRLSARGNPAAGDLVRHAFADVGGNPSVGRSWAKLARALSSGPAPELTATLARLDLPVLLLWADEDPRHPLGVAEDALARLPDGLLRVLPGTGFLLAYDDPVGVARELAAFCGQGVPSRP